MRFFIPWVPDAEARAAWERMRQACEAHDTRPIYSIGYEHNGTEGVVTAGEEGVIAIIAGQPFYIFEVAENPKSVPWESVTESRADDSVSDRRTPPGR